MKEVRTHSYPRFIETLRELHTAQKPGAGVPAYTRWVNRRIARIFAATAVSLGIGPNGVTALSAACSIAGLTWLLVTAPSTFTGVAAATLFALGYALDSADGQVARVTGVASPAGEWLDHVIDAMRTPCLHLAAAVGYLRFPEHFLGGGWALAWMPLLFAVLGVGHFMSQILAEQLRRTREREDSPTEGTLRSFINLHMDAGTLCWIYLLWGFGSLFVIAYALLLTAHALTTGISMRRRYLTLSNLPKKES